ncbi:tellurite resistance/C4-dicarboxylate transporter family protein [Streptomyces sp. DT171]|uniref:tellurite resistance/C4-dicarboxylate transporter family protein n=1 Tax=Streptomyces sp. DT171 TaxID=3416524 RepID=UPI003CE6992B
MTRKMTERVLCCRVREPSPGCFAPVMASGVVSRAAAPLGHPWASDALFAVAAGAYAVLTAAVVRRLIRHRDRVVRDLNDPARIFGFFTFVAASDVLAARPADARWAPVTAVLLVAAVSVWAALAGQVVRVLRRSWATALRRADGSWFLSVVGLQSVVPAAAALRLATPWRTAELVCWGAGVCLYALVTGVTAIRLRRHRLTARELTPPYWVAMGSGAISVLAGARLLPDLAAGSPLRPVTVTVLLTVWCWASCLLPLLVAAGVWRHGVRRVPLVHDPAWWTIVFPLGMYAVATEALGAGAGIAPPAGLGRAMAWAGTVAWLLVATGALVRGSRVPTPEPAGHRAAELCTGEPAGPPGPPPTR